MRIVEYDDLDPLSALNLSLLALDFPLTPEHAAHIRRTDPRPFPCLAIYALEDDLVLGQVGIFRLPMVSTEGREDVGGIWAVSTHPEHSGRGVASMLMDEAHARMRAAGLRFSTLGTNRYRTSYRLYRQHGYEDLHVWGAAFAAWDTAHRPTRLRAEPVGSGGYEFIEQLFGRLAGPYLGFAWRHTPFTRLRDKVNMEDIRVLWENAQPVGYALMRADKSLLSVSSLMLREEIDAAEAVAALAANLKASYVRVALSRPVDIASLRDAGYRVAHPNWGAFMLKPLLSEITVEDARRLFGIGGDRFLISWLDTT